MEINAAASVLLQTERQSPLSLLASKSRHGHGEPAAGLIALQHASLAAGLHQQLAMSHLRILNPYITGILDMLPEHTSRAGMSAARQPGPRPADGTSIITATSSFAFMVGNRAYGQLLSSSWHCPCDRSLFPEFLFATKK